MSWILGDEHHSSPSTNSVGRFPPFTRDLRLWLVLCLTYIALMLCLLWRFQRNVCVFFQLIILRPIRILPVTSAKEIRKTICILTCLKICKPSDLHFTGGPFAVFVMLLCGLVLCGIQSHRSGTRRAGRKNVTSGTRRAVSNIKSRKFLSFLLTKDLAPFSYTY